MLSRGLKPHARILCQGPRHGSYGDHPCFSAATAATSLLFVGSGLIRPASCCALPAWKLCDPVIPAGGRPLALSSLGLVIAVLFGFVPWKGSPLASYW